MGGVAGHLMHLYDNRELSYNELLKYYLKPRKASWAVLKKRMGLISILDSRMARLVQLVIEGDMSRGGMNAAAVAARKYKGGPQVRQVYVDSFSRF